MVVRTPHKLRKTTPKLRVENDVEFDSEGSSVEQKKDSDESIEMPESPV